MTIHRHLGRREESHRDESIAIVGKTNSHVVSPIEDMELTTQTSTTKIPNEAEGFDRCRASLYTKLRLSSINAKDSLRLIKPSNYHLNTGDMQQSAHYESILKVVQIAIKHTKAYEDIYEIREREKQLWIINRQKRNKRENKNVLDSFRVFALFKPKKRKEKRHSAPFPNDDECPQP